MEQGITAGALVALGVALYFAIKRKRDKDKR